VSVFQMDLFATGFPIKMLKLMTYILNILMHYN
jgi:hypothetical protein